MKGMARKRLDNDTALADALVGVLQNLDRHTAPKGARGRVCTRCGALYSTHACDICPSLKAREEFQYLAAEIEWLRGSDTPANIARRLGYTNRDSLARKLHRNGRPDLAALFADKSNRRPQAVVHRASTESSTGSLSVEAQQVHASHTRPGEAA